MEGKYVKMIKSFVEDEKEIDKLLTDDEKLIAIKKLKAKKRRELGNFLGRKVKLYLFTRQYVEHTTRIKVEDFLTGYISWVDDQVCSLSHSSYDDISAVGTFKIVSFEI